MTQPSVVTCAKCGSGNVGVIAQAVWSVDCQSWTVIDVFGEVDCDLCQDMADVTVRPLPKCTTLIVSAVPISGVPRWQIAAKYRRTCESVAHFADHDAALKVAAALSARSGCPVKFCPAPLDAAA